MSYYCAIQFVPDPIADERINIGVIAFDQRVVLARTLKDWRRVHRFAHGDIGPLREFAASIEARASGQLFLGDIAGHKEIDRDAIERAIGGWVSAVQISEPRPSLMPVTQLLEQAARTMLWEPRRGGDDAHRRHRSEAAQIAYRNVDFVVRGGFGSRRLAPTIQRRKVLDGAMFEHQFDVVVNRDSAPILAMHALSFEVKGIEAVVKTAAFAVKDVREKHPDLPIGVMALVTNDNAAMLDDTRAAVTRFGGVFLTEERAAEWLEGHLLKKAS